MFRQKTTEEKNFAGTFFGEKEAQSSRVELEKKSFRFDGRRERSASQKNSRRCHEFCEKKRHEGSLVSLEASKMLIDIAKKEQVKILKVKGWFEKKDS